MKRIFAVAVAAAASLQPPLDWHGAVIAGSWLGLNKAIPDRIDRTGAAMGVVAPGSVPPGA
jgi:hypothetical protein